MMCDYYSVPKVMHLKCYILSIVVLNVYAIGSYHEGMKGCSAFWLM